SSPLLRFFPLLYLLPRLPRSPLFPYTTLFRSAWIVEKFRTWSDCDGDVERRFSKDELLTNVTLYWVTETITSSTRLYYEMLHADKFPPRDVRVDVPTGCAIFPREILKPPRAWAERLYEVRRWTRMPRGGHFAA